MELIFMDVGANTGQTLEAAVLYKFNKIFCFEPVPSFYDQLKLIKDLSGQESRIQYCNYGLLDADKTLDIYGAVPGPDGFAASIYKDHQDVKACQPVTCKFVKATKWMEENLTYGDVVIMKLNCEGAEIAILDDLIDNNMLSVPFNIMIDFDAIKVPSQKERVQPMINYLIKRSRNIVTADKIMFGATHVDRICHWLDTLRVPRITQ